jgi:hypothetical protein
LRFFEHAKGPRVWQKKEEKEKTEESIFKESIKEFTAV